VSKDKRTALAEQQIKFQQRTEKLFLLLSSDQDREVATAARALLRHLDSAGIDMHRAAKALAFAARTGADVLKAKQPTPVAN